MVSGRGHHEGRREQLQERGREGTSAVGRLEGSRQLVAAHMVRRHIQAPEGRARLATEPLGRQGVLPMGLRQGARWSKFMRCRSVCRWQPGWAMDGTCWDERPSGSQQVHSSRGGPWEGVLELDSAHTVVYGVTCVLGGCSV